MQQGQAFVAGVDKRRHAASEHERVPERAGPVQGVRRRLIRLFHEAPDAMERGRTRLGQALAELDPPIVGFRLAGLRPQEYDLLGTTGDGFERAGHPVHEHAVVRHEVIRGENHHGGFRIPGLDPVGGEENGRRRAPVRWLLEHMRGARLVSQLRPHVATLPRHGHDHRALGRDTEAHAIERLSQERRAASENGVLLRPVLAVHVAGEPAKPHALAPGQHHRPRLPADARSPLLDRYVGLGHGRPRRNPHAIAFYRGTRGLTCREFEQIDGRPGGPSRSAPRRRKIRPGESTR